jgi:hypothetical protein
MPTTHKQFYGKFVRSAYHKESGDGTGRVRWNVNIKETGNYDIYYYYEGDNIIPSMRWRRRQHERQREDAGEKHFIVHHENGVEEVTADLNMADEGWNYLGTFRLKKGANYIELTDKNTRDIVFADAIKWVKK